MTPHPRPTLLPRLRTFKAYRPNVPTDTHDENQRNAPDAVQFEGCVFSDGSVALRWLTAKRSTSVWQSLDDAMSIHGHPEYGSYLVWDKDDLNNGVIEQRLDHYKRENAALRAQIEIYKAANKDELQ